MKPKNVALSSAKHIIFKATVLATRVMSHYWHGRHAKYRFP
jgi:hypothetical protein